MVDTQMAGAMLNLVVWIFGKRGGFEMKQVACLALAVVVLVAISGCGGPFKLTRGFDDTMNQKYVENPWLYGNAVSTVIAQVIYMVLGTVDMVFLNVYDFWFKSAWPFGEHKGTGTGFKHKGVSMPK